SPLRRGAARVGARAADAVVLLGDVDEAKVERESPYHGLGLSGREAAQRLEEGPRRVAPFLARPAPSRDGELADALLEGKEVLALELDENLAEQSPEPAHVASQRPVDFARAFSLRLRLWFPQLGARWHEAALCHISIPNALGLHEPMRRMKVTP